jgi:hypothetical protein
MPQAYIQFAVLLHWPKCVGEHATLVGSVIGSLYFSLTISTLSVVFAVATKFEHLYDRSGDAGFTLAVWLYFAADSISRGLAVAMAYGTGGGAALLALGGGWVMLDLSNDAGSQMASWAANDWAIFATDPANKTVKPSDVGITNFTAEMMNSFIDGFAIAGAACQIVTLE